MNQENLNSDFNNQEINQPVNGYNTGLNRKSKKPLAAIIIALIFIACAIVFAIFNRNVNKDSSEKSDNVKIKDEYFTTETLYYTEGLDGKADHYAYAIFEPNGKYTFQYVGEMTYGDSGLYVVSGQTLNLTAIYHITSGSYSMLSESSTVDFSNKNSIKIGNYTLNVVSSDKLKSLDEKSIISRYNDVKKQYINDNNASSSVSPNSDITKNVVYDYAINNNGFKEVKTLTINNVDVSMYVKDGYNSLNIDKQSDFVIITYSSGGTCGAEDSYLFIFDYNGRILYQSKEYVNILDKLVYSGKYNYNSTDNSLTINYELGCDIDCDVCEKLIYNDDSTKATCSTINKYRDVNSKEVHKVKYLGNGNFSSDEIVSSTKIINDSYYAPIFEECN